MKLNIGCGDKTKEDYINIDLHNPAADVFVNAKDYLPYEDNTVDEIYSSHLIEHFTPLEFKMVLTDWSRVLKRGGVLKLECPDLESCARQFLKSGELGVWFCALFGEPDKPGQAHMNGFTKETLIEELEKKNFNIIKAKVSGTNIVIKATKQIN